LTVLILQSPRQDTTIDSGILHIPVQDTTVFSGIWKVLFRIQQLALVLGGACRLHITISSGIADIQCRMQWFSGDFAQRGYNNSFKAKKFDWDWMQNLHGEKLF